MIRIAGGDVAAISAQYNLRKSPAHGAKPNDGLVLVSSAKVGNFRGCIPADHADEIGVFSKGTLDKHTGFDFVRFHRNLAFDLAARGF